MACELCPFGNNGESEHLQNIGCLPMPSKVVAMKEETGKNWACHNDERTICSGFVSYVDDMKTRIGENPKYDRFKDMDTNSGELITFDQWSLDGLGD